MGLIAAGFGETAWGCAASNLVLLAASCVAGAAVADRGRSGDAEAGRLPLGGLEVPGAGAELPPTGLVLTATGISFTPGLHPSYTNQLVASNISPNSPFRVRGVQGNFWPVI